MVSAELNALATVLTCRLLSVHNTSHATAAENKKVIDEKSKWLYRVAIRRINMLGWPECHAAVVAAYARLISLDGGSALHHVP